MTGHQTGLREWVRQNVQRKISRMSLTTVQGYKRRPEKGGPASTAPWNPSKADGVSSARRLCDSNQPSFPFFLPREKGGRDLGKEAMGGRKQEQKKKKNNLYWGGGGAGDETAALLEGPHHQGVQMRKKNPETRTEHWSCSLAQSCSALAAATGPVTPSQDAGTWNCSEPGLPGGSSLLFAESRTWWGVDKSNDPRKLWINKSIPREDNYFAKHWNTGTIPKPLLGYSKVTVACQDASSCPLHISQLNCNTNICQMPALPQTLQLWEQELERESARHGAFSRGAPRSEEHTLRA